MDEAQTIQLAKNGDLAAFNRLVMAYQGLAYNVAFRTLGDAESAADVCQEAFLSAFKNIRTLRGENFKSWLLRIVTNTCYDLLRYKSRRPASSLEEITTPDGSNDPDHSPWLMNGNSSPEEKTIQHELGQTIQQGIDTLPPDQKIAIVLSDVQGFSYQEIADITGVSLGTVKSRLSRARARLRDYLTARPELLPVAYRLSSVE